MFRNNKLCAILCAIGALSVAQPVFSAELSETGDFLDGVAAVVNEGVVLKSQLRNQTSMIIERAAQSDPPLQLPPPDVLREQLLERLIMQEIQLQRAERIGLQISDQMLNQSIEQLAASNGVAFADMPGLLAQDGIDYGTFRKEFRDEMTLEQLRQIEVGRRIQVSPREIEQCIADLEGNVAVDSDYNLSHILVSIPESATADEVADFRIVAFLIEVLSTGGEDVVLSLSEFAGEDIQLQFRSYGSSTYNFDYWYIYNVMITALFDNDLAAIEVLGPPNAEINQPDMWQVIVRNIGMFEQNSFTVKLFQEGGLELGSINVSETIQPLEVIAYNFYWIPEVLEETELYGEVVFIDDEFEDNNITQDFGVSIFPEGERQYLLWDNDNDSHYTDPNTGITKNCEDGIEETLTANGIDYQLVTELPKVLRNYNVVFVCLGLYCVG